MTKQQAIEILNAVRAERRKRVGEDESLGPVSEELLEALDRAGLFLDEETAAEIAIAVRDVYANEEILDGDDGRWRVMARRLATACRKVGLGSR